MAARFALVAALIAVLSVPATANEHRHMSYAPPAYMAPWFHAPIVHRHRRAAPHIIMRPVVHVIPSVARPAMRAFRHHRAIARRIAIGGGILALPVVVNYSEPVALDVPGIGDVDVPEDAYTSLSEMLSSTDPADLERALELLREYKRAHADKSDSDQPDNAQVEQHGPIDMLPASYSRSEESGRRAAKRDEPIDMTPANYGR